MIIFITYFCDLLYKNTVQITSFYNVRVFVKRGTQMGVTHQKKSAKAAVKLPARNLQTLRAKRKPGPQSIDAPSAPERDLVAAALMLDLIDQGSLKPNKPHLHTPQRPSERYRVKRLSQDEEVELARKVQQYGDLDARNALVAANMGLVHLIANQFFRPHFRYEDLAQEGILGLIRATETFEPERGLRFSTYSVYWIRAKIQRLVQKTEKDDSPDIIGAEWEIDGEGHRFKPRARKLSLEYTNDDEDSRSLGDILASNTEDPEKLALRKEKKQLIAAILNSIIEETGDERLRDILRWRLMADEPETLAVLGDRLNLSREGARILEAKMIRLAKERLRDWQNAAS